MEVKVRRGLIRLLEIGLGKVMLGFAYLFCFKTDRQRFAIRRFVLESAEA